MRDQRGELVEILGGDVSRETVLRLHRYLENLRKWNPAINLVSKRSIEDGWTRHVLDSAQVFSAAGMTQGRWLDIGSGGGFPGAICAILAAELGPAIEFTLVDSDKRKCAFVTNALRTQNVPVTVIADRIEVIPPQGANIVSARAVAPLDDLLGYAERHLAAGGKCLFQKGKNYRDELTEARAAWRFNVVEKRSITDPHAVTLVLGDIERA